MWAVTSLWPQKVAFRSQNYSARAKLMLISDQARDLVKICLEAGVHVPLSKRLVYIIASHAGVFRGARISSLPTNAC